MSTTRRVLWPHVPRLAADDPARRRMAANLAATHNQHSQPWLDFARTQKSQEAWRVYAALCRHVNEAGECWVTRKRLAVFAGRHCRAATT